MDDNVSMLSEMWGVRSFRRFGGLFDRIADVGASYGPSKGLRPPLDHIGDDHQSSMWPIALRSALVALSIVVTAQIGSAQDSSWTTSSQQSDPNGAVNPTRSRTTHSEVNGHVIEKTVTETLGPDGRYIPYSEVERESIRVNDSTTRSVERSYGRDADGRRSLTQQTQEESRSFSDGSKKMTRTTSNPDGNGALQVIQRAEIDSKVVSPGVRDTNTTMFSADGSGGLGATMRIEERERRTDPATVEYTKSTSLADGNGRWAVSETREGTTRQDPGGTTKEERVLRPNADGKMAVVERTVSKEPAGGQGGTVETYSRNVPGQAGDEGLKLVKRENTVQRSGLGGDRQTTRRVEQANPGDPGSGLRVTQEAIDIVRPGSNGVTQQQSTMVTTDANGHTNEVWVDMGSSNKPAAVKVEKAPAKKSK